MSKNPENMDISNPDHEEEAFLKRNDKQHTYVPIEQIPDTVPFDAFEKEQKSEDEEDGDGYDVMQAKIDEKKATALKNEILKFHQGSGTASVYTEDHEEEEKHVPLWELEKSTKKEDEFKGIEKEPYSHPGKKKTAAPVTSMSPEKVERIDRENRKYKRNTGEEHDNLKTFKKAIGKDGRSKMERSFRQKIREFFTKQNHRETPLQKFEDSFDDVTHEDIAA